MKKIWRGMSLVAETWCSPINETHIPGGGIHWIWKAGLYRNGWHHFQVVVVQVNPLPEGVRMTDDYKPVKVDYRGSNFDHAVQSLCSHLPVFGHLEIGPELLDTENQSEAEKAAMEILWINEQVTRGELDFEYQEDLGIEPLLKVLRRPEKRPPPN